MSDALSQGSRKFWSLDSAYDALNIREPTASASDGDVVVGFQQRYSSTLAASDRANLIGALELVSTRRRSQLLAFVLTIIPHLTKDNVAILASPPVRSEASLPTIGQQPSGNASLTRVLEPATTAQHSGTQVVTVNPVVPLSEYADTLSAASVDEISVPSEENYSTCFYNSLSEEDDGTTDYESEESMDGKFWNGQTWHCDDCNNELVGGECPLGHEVNPCKSCEYDREDCICADDQSTSDEEEDDLAGDYDIVWDDQEGIWRCTACLWEVEANSEDDWECHCVSNPEDTSTRFIELLNFHDYEPADSDSSGQESDYETDSGDESFIDDDGPFDSSLLDVISHPSEARDGLEQQRRSVTLEEVESPIESIEPESMDTT